jgi:hypothetical protein
MYLLKTETDAFTILSNSKAWWNKILTYPLVNSRFPTLLSSVSRRFTTLYSVFLQKPASTPPLFISGNSNCGIDSQVDPSQFSYWEFIRTEIVDKT